MTNRRINSIQAGRDFTVPKARLISYSDATFACITGSKLATRTDVSLEFVALHLWKIRSALVCFEGYETPEEGPQQDPGIQGQ